MGVGVGVIVGTAVRVGTSAIDAVGTAFTGTVGRLVGWGESVLGFEADLLCRGAAPRLEIGPGDSELLPLQAVIRKNKPSPMINLIDLT